MACRRAVTCSLALVQCYLETLTNAVALILDKCPPNVHTPAGLLFVATGLLEVEGRHCLPVLQEEMLA